MARPRSSASAPSSKKSVVEVRWKAGAVSRWVRRVGREKTVSGGARARVGSSKTQTRARRRRSSMRAGERRGMERAASLRREEEGMWAWREAQMSAHWKGGC